MRFAIYLSLLCWGAGISLERGELISNLRETIRAGKALKIKIKTTLVETAVFRGSGGTG